MLWQLVYTRVLEEKRKTGILKMHSSIGYQSEINLKWTFLLQMEDDMFVGYKFKHMSKKIYTGYKGVINPVSMSIMTLPYHDHKNNIIKVK